MFLAHKVVPSSGSTAISTFGPALMPTFSPMNSIGASSRSPSPITTVPSISVQLVEFAAHRVDRGLIRRLLVAMAAQPRRRHGRALRHPHDLEREDALEQHLRRNGNMGRHWRTPLNLAAAPAACTSTLQRIVRSDHALVFFDPYHLRPAADHLVALHRLQGAIDRILGGSVGNQNDRHRRSFALCARSVNAIGMTLHNRFN